MQTNHEITATTHYSDATKRFLLAAKRAEITVLEQLSSNCRIVISVRNMVHALQRERGATNIYLASKGDRFAGQRATHIEASCEAESMLRSQLKSLYLTDSHDTANPRLLSSITLALQGIDYLPVLREQAKNLTLSPLDSTRAYCRLVAGLLTVIFEAADIASDPVITRLLVALFNFMQGKEYAGQERAWGAIGFAETHFDKRLCDKLSALQHAQQHHFTVFNEFARTCHKEAYELLDDSPAAHDISQLRKMIAQLADGSPIAAEISEVWFDVATRRIDAMQEIENKLTDSLTKEAQTKVSNAHHEMKNHQRLIESFTDEHAQDGSPLTMLFDPSMPGLVEDSDLSLQQHDMTGSGKNTDISEQTQTLSAHRSFYDLLRGQAQYIEDMSRELDEAKRAITEHKLVDRAKLILMQQFQLNENDAYRKLQKQAMNEHKKLTDIAATVVEISNRANQR